MKHVNSQFQSDSVIASLEEDRGDQNTNNQNNTGQD